MWPEQPCIEAGLPFDQFVEGWPKTRTTGFGGMLQDILRDLYGFDKPLTAETMPELRETFAACTAREDWVQSVFEKCNIRRLFTSHLDVKPVPAGAWEPPLQFTIEAPPIASKIEYDSWGERLRSFGERTLGKPIESVEELDAAMAKHYDAFDWSGKNALVAWIGGEADFTPADERRLNELIRPELDGVSTGLEGMRLLEAAQVRSTCRFVRDRGVPNFQFCYGTQYVTPAPQWAHPIPKAAPQMAETFAHILGEFPEVHFNLLNGRERDEPIWCGLVQGYGNLSVANYWWLCFFPEVMHNGWARRLDMMPLTKMVGFFSDGWCVDYVYGRLKMVRKAMANVLSERIDRGFLDRDGALHMAREMFHETPRRQFVRTEL